jgi:succinyl-diaminopimelate desuccinylase
MDVVGLTKKLVSINSENPPGNEKDISKFIYDYLRDLKIPSELIRIEGKRYNVVGYIGKGNGLMFNGHTDTVPAGNLDNWKYDPFKGKIVGKRVYGLGTSDMKSGVAAMMIATKNMRKRAFKRKLLLTFVADEEVSQRGSKFLIEKKKNLLKDVKYGIVGEPREMNVGIGNKGIAMFKIKFFGKAAHGSMPELGDNAIYKATKFVQEVERLPRKFRVKDNMLGKGTINVGKISGGTKINVVPDYCEVEIDRRIVPGETARMALNQLKTAMKKAKVKGKIELADSAPPLKIDKNSKIVRLVKDVTKGRFMVTTGYNESELYSRKAGIECVVSGPGRDDQCHVANEHAEIPKLRKGVKCYEEIIRRWCC